MLVMLEHKDSVKRYTLGALLLHTTVLFGFAIIMYSESFSYAPYFLEGIGILFSVFAGGFGLVAIWITGEHYEETLQPRKLKMWGGIHVGFLIFPVLVFLISFILSPSIASLSYLMVCLVLITPPVLIIVFAGRESMTKYF